MNQSSQPRGYALVLVLVIGIVLASLALVLALAAGRDRMEARQQQNAVRALYAAEGGVQAGIEAVRQRLATNPQPDLTGIVAPALPNVNYEVYAVNYVDAAFNVVPAAPNPPLVAVIATGPNAGLVAQQTPIQVLATASVNGARATVADAVRVDVIPIFQFAVFMDGDFELLTPAEITIRGRVHTNGDFYLSTSGATIDFNGAITAVGNIRSHAAHDFSSGINSALVTIFDGTNMVPLADDLPRAVDDQRAYLDGTFGGRVRDASMDQQPLNPPIELAPADLPPDVVSRPSQCASGDVASFEQAEGIEIIRRPDDAYSNVLYDDGQPPTRVMSSDFGPRPTGQTVEDQVVDRSVPVVNADQAGDDAGAVGERMYWKADIRIIDGIWYRQGSNVPVFDPETWDLPDPVVDTNDVGHKLARVLRYSWFWDARENRVYPGGGNENQRGMQMRVTDFDVAAFNAAFEDPTILGMFFPSGVPAQGIVVYVSETYDPAFEDANTQLPRTANVRNFLDFHVMDSSFLAGPPASRARSPQARVAAAKGVNAPSPTQRGWYPANLWGDNAPAGFRSLTPAQNVATGANATSLAEVDAHNADPRLHPQSRNTWGASFACQEPSLLTAAPIPASRPVSFAVPVIAPPCIQSGATPLGAENAIRVVRAQTVPAVGLTITSDDRLYLHGDVNVRGDSTVQLADTFTTNTFQDLPGSVAFIADSVTILSARFSDRVMQRGGSSTAPLTSLQRRAAFFASPDGPAPGHTLPWSAAGVFEDATQGAAPNLCSPGRQIATTAAAANDGMTLPGDWAGANHFRQLRLAVPTRVNASLLMGDVPACLDVGGGGDGNASGGVNNFPRFAEQWFDTASVPSVIYGSMVSLFRSERGNSRFRTTNFGATINANNWTAGLNAAPYADSAPCVYSAPSRRWSFDEQLLDPANLPPGTPRVFATQRLRWVRR